MFLIMTDMIKNFTKTLGASVNGKPTVSKTVTAGSIPAAPADLKPIYILWAQ